MSKRVWPDENEWAERLYQGALLIAARKMARLTFLVGTYYPEVFDADFARVANYIKERRARRCTATTTQSRASVAAAI